MGQLLFGVLTVFLGTSIPFTTANTVHLSPHSHDLSFDLDSERSIKRTSKINFRMNT